MKRILIVFVLALFSFLAPKVSAAATYDWQAASGVSFRMWIPDGVPVIRGFYYHFNESATDGRIYATKYRWQEWAKTMGFGIIGTYWTGNAPGGNTAAARQAMIQFASMSGHPEIVNAPVLAEGISYGGATSVSFAATYPQLTIAYLSGASGGLPTSTNPQFLKTPGLIYRGDHDPDLANALKRRDEVITLRRQGAQVSFWIQWGFGHEFGYADDMGLKFLSDVVRLRYPAGGNPANGPIQLVNIPDTCGWLADWTTWESAITYIDSYNNFTPGPNNGFWLPNKDFAYVYRSHATKVLPLSLSGGGDVNPNRNVSLSASISLSGVQSVSFYDGAQLISTDTSSPYTATWVSTNLGAHTMVAVANMNDGSKRTGYTRQVMVLGNGSPFVVGVPSSCNQPPPPPPPPIDAGVPGGPDAGVCMCPCDCDEAATLMLESPSNPDDFPHPEEGATTQGGGCNLDGRTGIAGVMLSLLGIIFIWRRKNNGSNKTTC